MGLFINGYNASVISDFRVAKVDLGFDNAVCIVCSALFSIL